jgi:all-trans-retinol 13,14-reductase
MASLAAVRAGTAGFVALKLLPRWVGRALAATGLVDLFTPFFKFARVTLDEHLRSLTGNAELRAVLSYSWGDYGTPPASASFATHALLTNHMLLGVAFPRGGSSEVARLLAATIREGGGDVLVRARVERLLFDGAGRAAGVRVVPARGAAVDLAARAVVSDAGVFNTFERLCGGAPAPGVRAAAARYLSHVRHGVGGLQLFVALRGTAEELALNTASLWAFEVDGGFDLSAAAGAFLARSPDALGDSPVPLLFISFPSTKCPDWETRYPGRSTCEVVTLANWEWFADGGPPGARSATYAARKEALKSAILAQLLKHFPQLQGRVLHATLGTPATNSFYLGAARGEMYGAVRLRTTRPKRARKARPRKTPLSHPRP